MASSHRRQHQAPAQAGKKDHRQAGRQHQQRGAQVGLLHDQADRNRQQHGAHREVERAQLAFALLEPPGQHQRHRDLQDFAGLYRDAQVEPARRALARDAEQRHRDQQRHAGHVQRHRNRHQALRRNLRHDEHDAGGNQHVAAMVVETGAVVEAGRIHGQQAGAGQHQHGKQQQGVETAETAGTMRRHKDGFSNTAAMPDYPAAAHGRCRACL